MRYIINDNESLRDLSSFFRVIFENRINIDDNQRDNVSPFYLFFVYSKDLFERADFLGDIISCDKKINMSVITFFDDFNDVPKESTQVIALDHDKGKIFDINDTTGMFQDFKCDICYHEDLLDYCHKLSNTKLNISSSYALPPVLTFLELFKSGKIDHLNVLERWQENDPTKSLKAEIGYDSYGDTMYLDLHQKYHGPHGLIAGMTGSGKSEFIMTFILSLAVNYHPYEVSFVLIDYKGGGMAKSFESLPHTAGIITNLDGSSIKRSLIAIESELTRRQAVFSSTAEKLGISNIDIYKYQKAYREGKVSKPMSHIFIIADEFAELKTQQPDFMAQLISAARIGRSLGVHLILATQKPSGVVDDQIWSNSKFRICLKVQDRADSMDMLKRPDAAALKETGRFYLQVGYNEMFVMGQSAWAGAPYVPSDTYEQDNKKEIVIVDTTGKEIIRSEFGDHQSIDSQTKQLDAITVYLHDVAETEKVHAQYLCLPPLPEFLLYSDLSKKYNELSSAEYEVKALVGEIDDPARQRKLPFVVNFSGEGNALLYGIAGSGKENFITMLLYDLICRHSSEEINFYILDLGSETLKTFETIPHVGGVIISGEDERFEKFFKMLKDSFYHRKKLFADFGGSIQSYYEGNNKKIPNILVIINNFESFIEQYERYSETLQFLTREGRRYGIFFLFSCVGTNAVRFKLMQNFKQLFVLQQNDITDYNAILGNTNGLIPSPVKGRGLVKYDETFEFQIALPTNERKLKSEINGLGKALLGMNMPLAKRISILPQYVTVDTFNDVNISFDHFPFGIYEEDLSTAFFDFSANPFVCVSASQVELFQSFLSSVFDLLKKNNFEVIQIGNSIEDEQQISECENLINQFFNTMLSRHKIKKTNESSSFDPLVVIINGFFDVYDKISVETKSLLEDALNQDISKYNIGIIIADSYDNVKKYKNKGWYKKSFKENGIWMGSGASSQIIFESDNRLRDDSLPANDFGFDFIGKDYKKVKLLSGGK